FEAAASVRAGAAPRQCRAAVPEIQVEDVRLQEDPVTWGIRAAAIAATHPHAFATLSAQGRGGAPPNTPPPTPRAAALFDITGYWVSLITEDWRYRQFTPAKGDYVSVPVNPEGKK